MKTLILLLFAATCFGQAPVPDGFGVNIHFTDPKPGEMKLLADAGFKWVRMDFTWGRTEREKGKYDFSPYDRLMTALDEHGIRALFILDYANRNYDDGLSPHTDEGRAAFARWAAAAVEHFKGRGILWEMWNEPNIKQFWKPTPNVTNYVALSRATGKAIKSIAPREQYCGPATSTIDLKFLEACFQMGALEDWDAVTVHPYRQKDPETVLPEYTKLRALIDKYAPKGKRIPIISGEWGYSCAWKKFDDERQGKYLPRQFLVNLMEGIPLSIWYDWRDDGTDPKEPEHHFGVVRHSLQETKPSYSALQTLVAELRGYRFEKRVEASDFILMFRKGPSVKYAAWTTNAAPREATVAGRRLTLSDVPQYISPQ
jgi:hypothetical protein